MKLLVNLGFVLVAQILISKGVVTQQQQSLQVWTAAGCSGTASHTATDSTNFTISGNTHYVKINGLWALEPCGANSCSTRIIRQGTGADCQPQPTTGSLRLHLTRFGDANQNEKKIHFFSQPNMLGTSLTIEGDETIDDRMPTTGSYFFTGANSWGLTLADGSERCLNYSATVGNSGYGVTYVLTTNLQIKSVKAVCTVTTSPTPPPTTGSTIPPTTGGSPTTTTPKTTVPTTPDSGAQSVISFGNMVSALCSILIFMNL